MVFQLLRRAYLGLLLLFAVPLGVAQQLHATEDPPQVPLGAAPLTSSSTQPTPNATQNPRAPGSSQLSHWNAGITFAGFHTSTTGWSTLFTPAFGYTINNTFAVDAAVPVYMFRLAESLSAHPKPDAHLVPLRTELSDAIFELHAQFTLGPYLYQSTFAFTVPTGDETYGLTTGRMTFDLNNHLERSYGRFTPILEIGAGDSSTLVNRQVNKIYTSLGPLAHFQLGTAVELHRRATFEADVYEQLPIGDQKIYSAFRANRPTIVVGYNVTEDNGFTNSLDLAIDSHTTLSGYYSRSLRRHTDTAGIGITYVLRGTPPDEETSSYDDLFR
ncbi:MAG TPA: hypothetical protein VIX90_00195 [Edaphobacter sp.]